jgi:hypothetical protein
MDDCRNVTSHIFYEIEILVKTYTSQVLVRVECKNVLSYTFCDISYSYYNI